MYRYILSIGFSLGLLSCLGCFALKKPLSYECNEQGACDPGFSCIKHHCVRLCQLQSECDANQVCSPDHYCVERKGNVLPQIHDIQGNDPLKANKIADGIVLKGKDLEPAIFELQQNNSAWPLNPRVQADDVAELVFPPQIRTGLYQVLATNLSGSSSAPIQLELPEVTPDQVLSKLNQSSGSIDPARIPIEAIGLGQCPWGYSRDTNETNFILCRRGNDEMVRVGDFWVDRYEAVVVSPGFHHEGLCDGMCEEGVTCFASEGGLSAVDNFPSTFPDNGNWSLPLYACSIPGPIGSRKITWFQAAQACALSGKHLISNEEWQMAAAGTLDPGENNGTSPGNEYCNTNGLEPRPNGYGSKCQSNFGAQDMVGNLDEWVATWQVEPGYNGNNSAWHNIADTSYGNDFYYHGGSATNIPFGETGSTCVANGETDPSARLPAALIRGGNFNNGLGAGVFRIAAHLSPGHSDNLYGFRCARVR